MKLPDQRCLVRWMNRAALALSFLVGMVPVANGASPAPPPELEAQPRLTVEVGSHSAIVRRISVAPGRSRVVTASDDKTARVWNAATGELLAVLRPSGGPGDIGRLYGAAVHPTEDLVAVGGTTGRSAGEHRILLFSIANGQLLKSFDARGGDVKQLAWAADGTVLLAIYAGDHAIRAFDGNGAMLYEQVLAAPSYGLAVAPDGSAAASSMDGQIWLLQARNGRVAGTRSFRASHEATLGLSFSPDASKLIVGYLKPSQAPEVFDVASGRVVLRLDLPKLEAGTLTTVAWSRDARQVAVSGSGYDARRSFPIFFFAAKTGRLMAQQDVARDTIFDLVALPQGEFAYASADGTWGRVSSERIELSVKSSIPRLNGAENLFVSADGRRIGWTNSWGRDPANFDFDRRLAALDASGASRQGLHAAKTKRGIFDAPIWQDTQTPKVNGQTIPLARAEVSRALAYFFDGGDAVLGTSHRLLRLASDGRILWETRNAGEVWSANLTSDNRMIVTGMSDGSLRWWRASDGVQLLALLVTRDGRWVTWTPEGYFDASAGADRLVGWSVNRSDGPGADHFSLSRFRDRFNRPDLIDRVLKEAITIAGLDQSIVVPRTAALARPKVASPPAAAPPAVPGADAPSSLASLGSAAMQFPPVVGPAELVSGASQADEISIPLAVRAKGEVELEVRVDGRPLPASTQTLPAGVSGGQTTTATLPAPAPGSLVQVIAKDSNGVSEPLGFVVQEKKAMQAAATLKPVVQVEQPSVILAKAEASMPAPAPSWAPPSVTQPRLFVLAIGISDYKKPEYRLGLAAKDAGDFAAAMAQQHGKLYRDVQTRALLNQDATRMAITANLKWLSDTVGPGDIAMLFLAGHGINATGGQYYFLPYEGTHEDLATTGLPEAVIRDTLGRMRGKALFFVDTCFGGNVVGNFSTASRELARMANDLAAAENGVVVFASSSGKQLSEENDAWGNGAFTKAVLSGLSGKADLTRTGRITFKGLDFFISEEVRKLTEGRQTPVTISPIGVPDFTIARAGVT